MGPSAVWFYEGQLRLHQNWKLVRYNWIFGISQLLLRDVTKSFFRSLISDIFESAFVMEVDLKKYNLFFYTEAVEAISESYRVFKTASGRAHCDRF